MGNIIYTKMDFEFMASERRTAFVLIAKALGKRHEITRLMGSLAWGRHQFEEGAHGTLRTAIREMSALDGIFHALNMWARDHDGKAQRTMLRLYPQVFRSAPR